MGDNDRRSAAFGTAQVEIRKLSFLNTIKIAGANRSVGLRRELILDEKAAATTTEHAKDKIIRVDYRRTSSERLRYAKPQSQLNGQSRLSTIHGR